MRPDPDDARPGDDAVDDRITLIAARLEPADFERHEPPAGLWESISAAMAEETRTGARPDGATGLAATDPQPDRATSPAPVVHLASRRRTWLLAAAAVVAVAALAGVILAVRQANPSSTVVARARLDVLEGGATAEAKLVRQGDGYRLVITAHNMAPAPAGSFYELWLVDRGVTDPRPLGPMTGSTEVAVPASIDTGEHPVVDISLQPDGSHRHSGHSLLRGTLQ